MVGLGFETGTENWKAKMNLLSYLLSPTQSNFTLNYSARIPISKYLLKFAENKWIVISLFHKEHLLFSQELRS